MYLAIPLPPPTPDQRYGGGFPFVSSRRLLGPRCLGGGRDVWRIRGRGRRGLARRGQCGGLRPARTAAHEEVGQGGLPASAHVVTIASRRALPLMRHAPQPSCAGATAARSRAVGCVRAGSRSGGRGAAARTPLLFQVTGFRVESRRCVCTSKYASARSNANEDRPAGVS